MQRLSILGATGSIGTSTLKVVTQNPDRYQVFALGACSNVQKMVPLCRQWQPEYAVMADDAAALALRNELASIGLKTRVLSGDEGMCFIASAPEVDMVMAAIVGAAGLLSTMRRCKQASVYCSLTKKLW